MKRLPSVRTCNRRISLEENHVPTIRIEGVCGIHREPKPVAKCPHLRDGIGMTEGFSQRFCINQFLQIGVVGKQNHREILIVNLAVYDFLALQNRARHTKLRMYYSDQICCEK